jgi:hypothetical protein
MTTPNPTIDWHARARGLNLQTRPFIGGRFDDAPAEHAFDCVSPIDGKRIASLAEVGVRGVDAAVKAARKAFDAGSWANMAPRARKKVMLRLAALVDQHREELALLDTLCMGMPISISNGYCVPWLINALEWYGEAIDKLYDEVAPTDKSVLAYISKEPVGVVGAVLPWNWPMGLLGWKIPPALAAGNSIVLKPDEQTSLSALRFAGAGAGSRPPGRRVQRRHRRPGRRRGDRPARGHRRGGLHRIDRGREALHEVFVRIEHEARMDRMRRQGSEHCLRRCAGSRGRRADRGLRDLPEYRTGLRRRLAAHRRGIRPRPGARGHQGRGQAARPGGPPGAADHAGSPWRKHRSSTACSATSTRVARKARSS